MYFWIVGDEYNPVCLSMCLFVHILCTFLVDRLGYTTNQKYRLTGTYTRSNNSIWLINSYKKKTFNDCAKKFLCEIKISTLKLLHKLNI